LKIEIGKRRISAEFAERAECAEKSGEKRSRGVRSQEPTLRKRREGWGTLKFICLLPQLKIEEHRLKPVLLD